MVSFHLKYASRVARLPGRSKNLGLLYLPHTSGSTKAPHIRSYPLYDFFLEIRNVTNTMTNSPSMLRPTATGTAFLFLSRKHSSSESKRRWKNVLEQNTMLVDYASAFQKLVNTSFFQKFSETLLTLLWGKPWAVNSGNSFWSVKMQFRRHLEFFRLKQTKL